MEGNATEFVSTSKVPGIDMFFMIVGVLGCLIGLFSTSPFIHVHWLDSYIQILDLDFTFYIPLTYIKSFAASVLVAIGVFGIGRRTHLPLSIAIILTFLPYPLILTLSIVGISIPFSSLLPFFLGIISSISTALIGVLMLQLRKEAEFPNIYLLSAIAYFVSAAMSPFIGLSMSGLSASLLLVIFLEDYIFKRAEYAKH